MNTNENRKEFESKSSTTFSELYFLYLCHLMQDKKMNFDESKQAIEIIPNQCVKDSVEAAVNNDKYNDFKRLYKKYSIEELEKLIVNFKVRDRYYFNRIPKFIHILAACLLDIDENDKVLDLSYGMGYFFKDICEYCLCNSNNLFRYVNNSDYIAIDTIINSFSNKKVSIDDKNVFDENNLEKYDKIFLNDPYFIDENYKTSKLAEMQKKNPQFNEHISQSWFYNLRIMDLLKDNGKAVVIMRNGDLSFTKNKYIKEYFITKGYIETIISFPRDIFRRYFDINIVVLSKNNKSINFVHLTDDLIGKTDSGSGIKDNALNIVNLIGKNTDNSVTKTIDEIDDSNYNLNPEKMLEKDIVLDNPIKMKDVIESIMRGAVLERDVLESLITDENTNCKYVSITDIQDGVISKELKNLKYIDKRQERYCAVNGDLLISKSGEPVKIAVCEFDNNTKVLVGNNLYIVKLNKKIMNPYYLQAFFNSEKGKKIISRQYIGNMLKIISIESLNDIMVENNDMIIQEKVAKKQMEYINEVYELRRKISDLKNKEKKVFLED